MYAPQGAGHEVAVKLIMSDLNAIYSTRIMQLAAAIARVERLQSPGGTATAHSKLCGSTITVDVRLDGDRVVDYGQTVKACLLGQASASVVGRESVGSTIAEIHEIARQMRAMLKEGAPPPAGRWADLAALGPVRDHKARHASALLVFDALERAIEAAASRHAGDGVAAALAIAP